LYKVLLVYSRKLLNNNKQLNSINVISKTKLTCVQINCLHNFDNCFLFVVVFVIVVVAFVFAFAFVFVFVSIFLVSTFVSLASLALSLVFLLLIVLLIVILLALVALLNSFSSRNIKCTCELKKIETKLTIYNSDLILLLRICS